MIMFSGTNGRASKSDLQEKVLNVLRVGAPGTSFSPLKQYNTALRLSDSTEVSGDISRSFLSASFCAHFQFVHKNLNGNGRNSKKKRQKIAEKSV